MQFAGRGLAEAFELPHLSSQVLALEYSALYSRFMPATASAKTSGSVARVLHKVRAKVAYIRGGLCGAAWKGACKGVTIVECVLVSGLTLEFPAVGT